VLLPYSDHDCFLCVDFNALDFSRHETRESKKEKNLVSQKRQSSGGINLNMTQIKKA
jgi:hypothetical protein